MLRRRTRVARSGRRVRRSPRENSCHKLHHKRCHNRSPPHKTRSHRHPARHTQTPADRRLPPCRGPRRRFRGEAQSRQHPMSRSLTPPRSNRCPGRRFRLRRFLLPPDPRVLRAGSTHRRHTPPTKGREPKVEVVVVASALFLCGPDQRTDGGLTKNAAVLAVGRPGCPSRGEDAERAGDVAVCVNCRQLLLRHRK